MTNAKKKAASKWKKQKRLDPHDPNVLRLIPKRHKGILRLIFSRAGITAALIILQLAMFYSIYDQLRDYYEWFSAAFGVVAILTVFHLFSSDMDSTARLTWLLILMLAPVPGSLFLIFTENDIGHRAVKSRVNVLITETKNTLKQDEKVIADPQITDSATDDLCRYLNRSGCFPIYGSSRIKYFPLGEDKYAALMRELKKAQDFIFLEYFIIEEGYMWGSVLKVLAEKAKQGVDVRVMYDGMCEMSTLTADYPKRLERLGIKCKPFSRIRPFLSTHYNYRDHRKILVIDGKTAFTGGVNLADEYINKKPRYGHWKDTAIMVKGDAAESFTLMFLQMWNLTEPEAKWDGFFDNKTRLDGDGFIMPYCDCPLDSFKVGESVYMDILSRAKSYVHIMTPYLILDDELETALKFAAQRGVDVKLILPGIPDKKAVYALAKSHYKYLVEAGVKIYEYTPGFVHAKVFVCDGEKAVVGTINLDYRSLYHHFECAAYIFRSSCIADIEKDFQSTLARCRRVTPNTIKHEKLYYKLLGRLMRLIAPLL